MQTEAKASLVGGLGTLPAHLDSLFVDQDPDDLCKAPRPALTERDLYKMYLSSRAEASGRCPMTVFGLFTYLHLFALL